MKAPLILTCLCLALTACQSPKTAPTLPTPAPATQAVFVPKFDITGKIGITTQTAQGKQAVSAFYAWSQDDERFAIDLTGALGIGATTIRYDGQTATLMSEQGTLTATNPNDLLTKATGWHAPIDKLPHWILGRTADGDTDSTFEQGKLTHSKNGDWTATFDYANAPTPKRLSITHTDGHRVILTINHNQQ